MSLQLREVLRSSEGMSERPLLSRMTPKACLPSSLSTSPEQVTLLAPVKDDPAYSVFIKAELACNADDDDEEEEEEDDNSRLVVLRQ